MTTGVALGQSGGGIAATIIVNDGSEEELRILLKSGGFGHSQRDLRGILKSWERDGSGNTIVHTACENNDVRKVEVLIRHFRDESATFLDPTNDIGQTPVFYAARCGATRICQLLLKEGKCDPVRRDSTGWSPLHAAALGGHVDCVRAFLTRGADAFSFDNEEQKQSPSSIVNKAWEQLSAEMRDLRTLRSDMSAKRRRSVIANPEFVKLIMQYHGAILRNYWARCTFELAKELRDAMAVALSLRNSDDYDDYDEDEDFEAVSTHLEAAPMVGSEGYNRLQTAAESSAVIDASRRKKLHKEIAEFGDDENGDCSSIDSSVSSGRKSNRSNGSYGGGNPRSKRHSSTPYEHDSVHYRLLKAFEKLQAAVLQGVQGIIDGRRKERSRYAEIRDLMTPGWDEEQSKTRNKRSKKKANSGKGRRTRGGSGDLHWMSMAEKAAGSLATDDEDESDLSPTVRKLVTFKENSTDNEILPVAEQEVEKAHANAKNADSSVGYFGSAVRLGGHCDGELRRQRSEAEGSV